MVKVFLNKHKYYVIVLVIALIYTLLTLFWVGQDARPPHWDMARHLFNTEQYSSLLRKGEIYKLVTTYFYYPPFSYLVVVSAYLLLGSSISTAVTVNIFWLLVLGASFVSICESLKKPRAGIFALVFFITLPLVGSITKEVQLDFPLTAMLAANAALLIRAKGFSKFNFSVLYGVSFGLGMLTKWTFIIFAIWPLIIALIYTAKDIRSNSSTAKNLLVSALLGYSVAMPWYVANLSSIKIDFLANGVAAGIREGDPPVLSLLGLFWYPKNILEFYLRLPWLVVVLTSMFYIGANLKKIFSIKRELLYVVSVGVGGFLVFAFLQNKDIRYIMPVFITVSLVAGLGMDYMYRKGKALLVYLLLLLVVASFLLTSFATNLSRTAISTKELPISIVVWSPAGYITGAPEAQNWCMEDVMVKLRELGRGFSYSGPDTIWFNNWALQYFASREQISIQNAEQSDLILKRAESSSDDVIWRCQAADGTIVSLTENQK